MSRFLVLLKDVDPCHLEGKNNLDDIDHPFPVSFDPLHTFSTFGILNKKKLGLTTLTFCPEGSMVSNPGICCSSRCLVLTTDRCQETSYYTQVLS